ncbi:Transcription factor MYB1R1 [Quillaja saponaria]|uniref:Transcription factor MYB1R1 n=1 Tax=Quillaja saponaria TaxID=32244 RepID=A0AAD7LFS6_QUISA|nr:Transcription factor MYB1R1 [Quillaja saponaria]
MSLAADSAVYGNRDADGCGSGASEIMLFGVRVVVDSMRKSVSMNNLTQYEHPQDASNNNNKEDVAAAGYASADDAVPHNSGGHRERERKRGVPWTEEEHKLFLLGLQKVGKGDWRGISRNFVKTRTPTQVASHAQKYFLRQNNLNRRRRRSSLFDITTDTVSPMEEEQVQLQDNVSQSHHVRPPPETCNFGGYTLMPAFSMSVSSSMIPVPVENPIGNLKLGPGNLEHNGPMKLICPNPVLPDAKASTVSDINLSLNSTMDPSILSLKLSLPSDQRDSSSRNLTFQAMPYFSNGDSIISVA